MAVEKQDVSNQVSNPLTGALHIITLCTNDLDNIKLHYCDALGMTIDGPLTIELEQEQKLRLYWGLPADTTRYSVFRISCLDFSERIVLRLIVLDEETPYIHSSHDSKEIGPHSIGIVIEDLEMLRKKIALIAPDSIKKENSFIGPDQVRNIALKQRISSAHMTTYVTDRVEEELSFYTHVLGMKHIENDHKLSLDRSSLDIPRGTTYKCYTICSTDNSDNRLVLITYKDGVSIKPEEAPRLPNRGIAMWTFQTRDVGEILARAHAKQVKVYRTPRKINDPILGEVITMSLLTPTGFVVEVYSPH